MNAPNPIFEDWAEYEVRTVDGEDLLFRKNRNCGLPQLLTCMWASMLTAFVSAALLTIIILVVQ